MREREIEGEDGRRRGRVAAAASSKIAQAAGKRD